MPRCTTAIHRAVERVKKEIIGDTTLYLGDCLEIMPTLGKVDAVVTDPDYNAANMGPNKKQYLGGNPNLLEDEYNDFCEGWFLRAQQLTNKMAFTPGISNIWKYPPAGWVLCWHKPSAISFNRMGGFNAWEPILVYGKMCGRFGQDYFRQDPLNFSKGPEKEHPCPKPLNLWTWLLKGVTKEKEVVLDPFMGSGTTGVGCANLGRKFIGIEIEPKYFDIACKRINQAQRQGQIFQPEQPKTVQETLL